MTVIHVLWIEMPGRAPQVAGVFDTHMQAVWTMVAVCQVLTVRAAWVAGQHEPPEPRRVSAAVCCYGSKGE